LQSDSQASANQIPVTVLRNLQPTGDSVSGLQTIVTVSGIHTNWYQAGPFFDDCHKITISERVRNAIKIDNSHTAMFSDAKKICSCYSDHAVFLVFFFLTEDFFFFAVRKKSLLQVKKLLWQEEYYFVTTSRKQCLGIRNHLCGSREDLHSRGRIVD